MITRVYAWAVIASTIWDEFRAKFEGSRRSPAPHRRESDDRVSARRNIIRDVDDKIQSKAPPGEAQNLNAELVERLERPEFDDEIAKRSVAEIVTEICRDLGIGGLPSMHPWKRRMPRDITILNARAAQLYGQPPSPELAALLGHRFPAR